MSTVIIITSIVICFMLHIILYKQSGRLSLVELPGGRKLHQGATPLIGGISIYLSCVIALFIFPLSEYTTNFILLLLPIVLVGVVDDIFDISAKLRLAFQLFVSLITVNLLALEVGIFHLFSSGHFLFVILDQIITTIFIVAMMNAINMMDGMDGLAGAILLLSLLAIAYLQASSAQGDTNQLLNILVPGLLIFLFFNLEIKPGQHYGKVFMGDAGSMFLGFFLAVHLIHTSQGFYQPGSIQVPLFLWFVFLPLADMLSTLLGRIFRRKSPFKADRTHIHHILQRAGLHKHKALTLLVILHLIFIGIGILSFYADLNLHYTLALLTAAFIFYRLILSKAPVFVRAHNRRLRRKNNAKENFVTAKNIYDRVSI